MGSSRRSTSLVGIAGASRRREWGRSRCTSPASSRMRSPASVNTTSAPSSSMPRASPSAVPGLSSRRCAVPEARRARGRLRRLRPGPRGARSMPASRASSASRAASRSTGAPEAMRSDEAVSRSSCASSSRAVSTFSPMPITAHPSWGRASISTPGDLQALDPHVVRPLDPAGHRRDGLARLRHGDRDRQRQRARMTPCRSRTSTDRVRARPGGADHVRPCLPRPAVCRSATTTVPCGAPASASVARAVVGRPDESRWTSGPPERHPSPGRGLSGCMATA